MDTDFPLADSPATRMLAEGLARAKEEQGLSIRQIGKLMNYKTSVVLSHMASGRVPIPIDRTEEMADILMLDKRAFLQAVIRQRHPDVAWDLLIGPAQAGGADGLGLQLEAILGARLKGLTKEQRMVMREVAAERSPSRRWLSVHEMHAIEVLRQVFPSMTTEGIGLNDLGAIQALFEEQ